LISALDAGEWSSFTPLPLYPRKKSPRYALGRRLVGFRAGLDVVEKRKVGVKERLRNNK
jgi:hypothetical protein